MKTQLFSYTHTHTVYAHDYDFENSIMMLEIKSSRSSNQKKLQYIFFLIVNIITMLVSFGFSNKFFFQQQQQLHPQQHQEKFNLIHLPAMS